MKEIFIEQITNAFNRFKQDWSKKKRVSKEQQSQQEFHDSIILNLHTFDAKNPIQKNKLNEILFKTLRTKMLQEIAAAEPKGFFKRKSRTVTPYQQYLEVVWTNLFPKNMNDKACLNRILGIEQPKPSIVPRAKEKGKKAGPPHAEAKVPPRKPLRPLPPVSDFQSKQAPGPQQHSFSQTPKASHTRRGTVYGTPPGLRKAPSDAVVIHTPRTLLSKQLGGDGFAEWQ